MNSTARLLAPGVAAAFGADLLFGAGTPLAKLLLRDVSPWLLAGLFYLGSGIGLSLFRFLKRAEPVRLARGEVGWLAGAVLAGGVVGPVLLMFGRDGMPASGAALLLNAEGVLTALLAWVVFKENFDRRIAFGMAAIATGAVVLSWPGEARFAGALPALAVLGACLAWGIDNNLTRKVSLTDATWIAAVKGMAAGSVNLILAFALGGGSATRLADHGYCHGGRVFCLWGKSGFVCRRHATSWNGTHRGLFFRGSLLWRRSRTGYRRAADTQADHGRDTHGDRHLATPDRAP